VKCRGHSAGTVPAMAPPHPRYVAEAIFEQIHLHSARAARFGPQNLVKKCVYYRQTPHHGLEASRNPEPSRLYLGRDLAQTGGIQVTVLYICRRKRITFNISRRDRG